MDGEMGGRGDAESSPRRHVTLSPRPQRTIIFGNESQERACKLLAFAIISRGRVCFSQFGLPIGSLRGISSGE